MQCFEGIDIGNFRLVCGRVEEPSKMFRVFKSVQHRTYKRINQPDASVSQVYYVSFKYSSTFLMSNVHGSVHRNNILVYNPN